MCPACLVTILIAGVGTVGGASALLWSKRRRKAKPSSANSEPPSATFKEWVVAVISLEEALRVAADPHAIALRNNAHQPGLNP